MVVSPIASPFLPSGQSTADSDGPPSRPPLTSDVDGGNISNRSIIGDEQGLGTKLQSSASNARHRPSFASRRRSSSSICRCQQCLWPPLLPAAPVIRTGRKTMQVETSVTPVPLLALSRRSVYRSRPVLLLHRCAATVQRPMGMSAWQRAMLLCRSRRVDLRRAEGGQTGRWTIVASPSRPFFHSVASDCRSSFSDGSEERERRDDSSAGFPTHGFTPRS